MLKKVKSPWKYLLYSAVIIVVLMAIVFTFQIITTHLIKAAFKNIVSTELNKTVKIDGDFKINYSFSPSVQITNLNIINNEEWYNQEFVTVGSAYIKLEILPLLRNRIFFDEIKIKDAVVNLEKDAQGKWNWERPQENKNDNDNDPFKLPDNVAVNELRINDLLITYKKSETDIKNALEIENILISLPEDNFLRANLSGSYHDKPVGLNMNGGSYKEFKDPDLFFPFDIYLNSDSDELNITGNFKSILKPEELDLNFNLSTNNFNLEPVFTVLGDIHDKSFHIYRGNIGKTEFKAENLNKDLFYFLNLSSLDLSASDLQIFKINTEDNKKEQLLNFKSSRLIMNNKENTRLNIAGSLSGYPLSVKASSCINPLYPQNRGECKINARVSHGNSDFSIKGFINPDEVEREFTFNIKTNFNVPDIHQYDFLFDVPKGYVIPANASFKFEKNINGISIRNIDVKFGQSDLNGELTKMNINNRLNFDIILSSNKLNLNEIMSVLPKHDDDQDSDHSLKVRIFPKNLSVYDATTKIDLKNVIYHNLLIDMFYVNSRIKDNIETSSEFKILSADGDFKGIYDLNLAPDLPVAKFKINSRNVDLGKISHDLGFAENVNFNTKQLNLELNIVGSTLEEILLNSSLKADSKDGNYIVKDINTESNFEIFVNESHLELYAHKPILIYFDGVINEQDVKITLEAKHIIRSISALERGKVPVRIKCEFLDTVINIEGFAVFPLDRKTSEIRIIVKGKKLSDLNRLLDVDFPDKGPYRLTTDLNVTDQGYNLNNIDFDYAKIKLTGFLNIVTSGQKPYFDIKINAEVLNIDDLFSSGINTDTAENKAIKGDPSGEDTKIPQLNSFDVDLDFSISKIILNDEEIGDFEYSGKIINGDLHSDRAILNILGGEAELEINVRDVNSELMITLEGFLDNFDYSPIAKMINPESQTDGIMDIALKIETRGTTFSELDDNLDGEIKLRIVPTFMDASLVNIWALGIFTNLLPNFTQEENKIPKVNCIIGEFKAKDGTLRPSKFKIDTTKVRVGVKGKINLADEYINLVFTPVPKKAQLISLGIPVRVIGTFDNHHIITDPYNLGWYIIRLTYVWYAYFAEKVFKKYTPEDGSDICNREIFND